MTPLIDAALAMIADLEIDPKKWEERDWIRRIHPAATASSLPGVIHSEKDSEA
jgi:hypothetical protein